MSTFWIVLLSVVAGTVLSAGIACLPGLHIYNVMGALVLGILWLDALPELAPEKRYHFYNVARRVDLRAFGSLINTVSPLRVRQDSLVHNVLSKAVRMSGEREDVTAYGDALCASGVKLSPAFAGTGYGEGVRLSRDFSSQLYFMEEQPVTS